MLPSIAKPVLNTTTNNLLKNNKSRGSSRVGSNGPIAGYASTMISSEINSNI